MCSSRTPSLFARTAIVISFVLASGPVAAQPFPGWPVAHASDVERLEELDLRHGDAYTESKGVGMQQDSRARLARRSARVRPVVAAGRQGWTLGLRFSF